MRRTTTSPAFRSRRRALQAGFSLLEVLLALAIFSIGIIEVLAIFPAAVISGAKAVRRIHARIIDRTAIAEIEYQLRVPYHEGTAAGGGSTVITNDNISADDLWNGCYVALTNRLNTSQRFQQGLILDTDAASNQLFLPATAPFDSIQAGDHYRITALALPTATEPETDRFFIVDRVDDTNPNELIIRTSPSWAGRPWAGSPAPARFYIVFNKGEARDRPFRITETAAGKLIFNNAINFINVGVRSGDDFVIIGCPNNVYGSPTANFGLPNTVQTQRPPHLRDLPDVASPYSFATIWSNCYRGGTTTDLFAQDTVRLDVFVFFEYDPAKLPGLNTPPVAHFVHYLGRR